MKYDKKLEKNVNFRLFLEENRKVKQIVKTAKDSLGYKKYFSESHFYRCAVIRLIKEEL
jgi:hypothetical protein|tara:strand:+ start:9341 stop:9517 length:177 start_codon:yes stop_codon:yes gene_type:complete